MATLSVVATPIGNLEDITLRALRALTEADLVLCEDTRVTRKLLDHYSIQTPLLSYHARSGEAKYEKIFSLLEEDTHLVLVSDAGTPCVSDPGARLVGEVRARFGEAVTIESIPGPSALAAAVSIVGMPVSEFLFLGFLPHKKGRETLFAEIAASERAVVLYESPHRLLKTLASLVAHLDESRQVAVCRELTKIHEEVVRGSAEAVLAHYTGSPDTVRGEIVMVIGPR